MKGAGWIPFSLSRSVCSDRGCSAITKAVSKVDLHTSSPSFLTTHFLTLSLTHSHTRTIDPIPSFCSVSPFCPFLPAMLQRKIEETNKVSSIHHPPSLPIPSQAIPDHPPRHILGCMGDPPTSNWITTAIVNKQQQRGSWVTHHIAVPVR